MTGETDNNINLGNREQTGDLAWEIRRGSSVVSAVAPGVFTVGVWSYVCATIDEAGSMRMCVHAALRTDHS